MKINNKRIIVPTLAIAMACALAGSIAGSVAWYQYSTRATTGLTGTSAGSSRSLQLASELEHPEETDNLTDPKWGYHYAPEGKESFAPTAPLFKDGIVDGYVSHPVYQHFNNWIAADDENYFEYNLYFQSLNNKENKREALDIFLTAYELEVADASATNIIKNALRVELVPYTFDGVETWVKGTPFLLSENGGDTIMNDYLDLNGNKIMDHNGFAADDSNGKAQKYKANTPVIPEEGTDLTAGYFKDAALKNAPEHNSHPVDRVAGEDGTNLFTDADLTPGNEAEVDGEGKLVNDGTYYAFGADGTTKYYIENLNKYTSKSFNDVLANDDDPYNFVGGESLISTDEDYAVLLTVKVWLEGWQQDSSIANNLNEGAELIGYYSDTNCEEPAWSEAIVAAVNDSGVGLFTDKEMENPAPNPIVEAGTYYREARHEVTPVEGTDLDGYFADEDLSIPAVNAHAVHKNAGEDGTGLYTDIDLTVPAEVDGEGKLVSDGTYYVFGADGTTSYYHDGASATENYYAKGYVWDNASMNSVFNLGLRFAVKADK